MNEKFNGGWTFLFPNTFVDLPKTRRVWAKRGVCAYIYLQNWVIFRANVDKYSIHGAYGYEFVTKNPWFILW